jgi:hypothetical protein
MSQKITDDVWRDALNQLVLKPKMRPAAKAVGVNVTTLFKKIRDSIADPAAHTFEWLGHSAPFYQHINAARKLSTVALDHAARDLALNGHSEPRFYEGKPVWRVDPKIEADAITLDEFDWIAQYGARPRTDTFYRDPKTQALEQEQIIHPPNPAVLVKLLTSLAPEIYSEHSTVEHVHSGGVWVEGQSPKQAALPAPNNFTQDFGLSARPSEVQRPINTLAVPRPCVDSAEFDKRFRRKLLREVTLFRDADGKLMPPLPDDVLIAGSEQARAFQDAQIPIEVVRAEVLLDEGYENDFLRALAPAWKRKPGPKPKPPTDDERQERAEQAAVKVANKSTASLYEPVEKIGYGKPMPGGRRIVS